MIKTSTFDIVDKQLTSQVSSQTVSIPETDTSATLSGVARQPGSVTLIYTSGGVQYTLTNGTTWNVLEGDGTGSIDDNAICTFSLNLTPDAGTGITINYLQEIENVQIELVSKKKTINLSKFYFIADNPAILTFDINANIVVDDVGEFAFVDRNSTEILLVPGAKLRKFVEINSPLETVKIVVNWQKYPEQYEPNITIELY